MSDDELLQDLVDELADESEPVQEAPRLQVYMLEGETPEEAKARVTLTSEYHAADSIWVLNQITAFKEADLTNIANRLEGQIEKLKKGGLDQEVSMLAAQAYTLDALFHHLLNRSAKNMNNEFNIVERLMKLALKAQSQSRTTLDSIASMKKPPAELIKQTNIAHGHQQVNNVLESKDKSPARQEKTVLENELLEKTDGERLDTGTPSEAVKADSEVETVDKQHRAKNKRRQG